MCFEDFEQYFVNIEICHRSPFPFIDDPRNKAEKKWKVSYFEGDWVKNCSAGGRLCLGCKYFCCLKEAVLFFTCMYIRRLFTGILF